MFGSDIPSELLIFFKKLGTLDLFNVVLMADAQGKVKGWSGFISSYNGEVLKSFKNQGHQ